MLQRIAAEEAGRLALWAPVLFGAGCALGLGPAVALPLWAGFIAALGFGLLASGLALAAARRGGGLLALGAGAALAASLVALGICAAVAKVDAAEAPVAPAFMGVTEIDGWVSGIDRGPSGPRLTLRVARLGALLPEETPHAVRLTLREVAAPAVGAAVRCRAFLQPPPGPVLPGGYDFQRRAYFDRLGGVGAVRGPCEAIELGPPPEGWRFDLALWFEAARKSALAAIAHAAPGQGGALFGAIATGDRSGLSEETQEALQASGLAHLLSVSGLHMTLVAGAVFAALRFGLAAIEPLALRVNVAKIAAAGAILTAGAYMLFSGADAPARRAFIMAAVAFGAILLDRPAISVRALALAAAIVLALEPQAVAEPGFQMSFAATLALVAVYEALSRRPREPRGGVSHRVAGWIAASALTSLVAGLATLPFGLYHFQRVSPYSLPANVAAAPIVSFVVTPAALAAAAAAPFGLEAAPVQIAAWGMERVVDIAAAAEAAPGGDMGARAMPTGAWALMAGGLVWLGLWAGRLRWLGAGLIAAGALTAALAHPPVGWIAAGGQALAARGPDGRIALCAAKGGGFAARRLLQAADPRAEDAAPALARAVADARGCAVLLDAGGALTLAASAEAALEDCRMAGVVVSPGPVDARGCRAVVIAAADLPRGAILTADGALKAPARRDKQRPPWERPPPPPRER